MLGRVAVMRRMMAVAVAAGRGDPCTLRLKQRRGLCPARRVKGEKWWLCFRVILERSEESRIRRCAMPVKFLRSGRIWCCAAGVFTKTFHVKRFLVQEIESRIMACISDEFCQTPLTGCAGGVMCEAC